MNNDLIEFQTPYSRSNKLRRFVWNLVWACLARPFPRSMAMGWKRMLLRTFGAKIASTAVVYATVKVCHVAPIRIGRNATVSQRAFLCTAGHDITDPHHHQTDASIVIGDRTWVCAEAFVGQGVTIGEGAVVGARACVFKDVDSWTVVGGNPAKYIKTRRYK